jgi:hypothetical protein
MTTQRIHADCYKLLLTDAEPWRADGSRIVQLDYTGVDGVPYTAKVKVCHLGQSLKLVCPTCGQRVKSLRPSRRGQSEWFLLE